MDAIFSRGGACPAKRASEKEKGVAQCATPFSFLFPQLNAHSIRRGRKASTITHFSRPPLSLILNNLKVKHMH